jgi:hypothetical protein
MVLLMIKGHMLIDAAAFKKMKIELSEVIEYIENKEASSLKPIHVNSYQFLKNQPTVASS